MKHFHPTKATDAQLLIQFEKSRDQNAFAELVRRHGAMVLGTARRVLGSEEDVEEAFQATMFALARSAGKLRKKAAVVGWLHRTAFRCAIDIHRSNQTWKRKVERMTKRSANIDAEVETSDPLLGIANEELERILDEELASLSEKLRDVIVLCELEGLTQKQAAQQLGIPASTVNDRFKRGRKLLHGRLVRRGATLTLSGIAVRTAPSSAASASMAKDFIADISSKAALYAGGRPAAELGVSPKVIQVATKVAITMTKTKLITLLLMAVVGIPVLGFLPQIFGVPGFAARGGTIFIDEFDGDAVFPDGAPVEWAAFQNSQVITGTGELVVSGNGFPTAVIEGLGLENTSLRTEVLLRRGGAVTVYTRTAHHGAGPKGYLASLGADGTASILLDGTGEVLAEKSTNLNPMQDYVAIQFDAIGDELKLWVWDPNSPPPTHPLLEVTEDSGFVGDIGLGAAIGGPAEAVFRHAHLADAHIPVPEPSTAAISMVGLMILLFRTHMNSSRSEIFA